MNSENNSVINTVAYINTAVTGDMTTTVNICSVAVEISREAPSNDQIVMLGIKTISEGNLSSDQKKIAIQIYEVTRKSVSGFITDKSINNTIKITKTIGQVIKQLENVKVDGHSPSGADKKEVAIQLGRIIITEIITDDNTEAHVLAIYDLLADSILEAMLDVSRVVNVAIHGVATKCCPRLLSLFRSVGI